jgi:hypothetical protein
VNLPSFPEKAAIDEKDRDLRNLHDLR